MFRVLIAGGGVAAVEGLLAVRHMLGARVGIEVMAPNREFVYRPLAVAEPFGLGKAHRLSLAEIAGDRRASLRQARLTAVDPERRVALTDQGEEIGYEALLIAIGTRSVTQLEGALHYGGPDANRAYSDLLAAIEEGEIRRLTFAVPVKARWALPLYELALLTAQHAKTRGIAPLELTIVTPETRPLQIFGGWAVEAIERLLAEARIRVRASSAPSSIGRDGLVTANGETVPSDRVVTLPRLEVSPLPGIPQGPDGFIGTNLHMRVDGIDRVFAAGDATWFPVKQGGVAAQQADVAATSIAACLDPDRQAGVFRPVIRGALLTGSSPQYLRAEAGDGVSESSSASHPLWWPPSKIAARYLSPYLAHRGEFDDPPPLEDLPSLAGADERSAGEDHQEALDLAMTMAEVDFHWHDYAGALRWLDVVEQLNLALPTAQAALRDRCRQELRRRQPQEA